MFGDPIDELEGALDKLRIAADGPTLVRLFGLFGRFEGMLTSAVTEFDKAKLWDLDFEVSMTGWLRERAQMSTRAAGRMVAAGRRLVDLPATAEAWQEGRLSSGQVEAIGGILNQRTVPQFAEDEERLLPRLQGLSAPETANLIRAWKATVEVDPELPEEPERSVHLSPTFMGRWRLDGDLDPESGQIVHTAIRMAQTDDVEGEPERVPATRRADALVDVCKFFLDHQTSRPGGRHRPHLNLVVDLEDLKAGKGAMFVEPAGTLDAASASALLCDSALHRVVTAESAILDYGTSTRSIPVPLWNALVIRDGHCRFPGCDRPSWWCDGHHIVYVEDHGPTRLDNLALQCRRHHLMLHRSGWHAKLLPDGTFEVTFPDGTTRTSRPTGTLW